MGLREPIRCWDNHELGNKQFINGGAPAGTPLGKGFDGTNPAYDVNATGTHQQDRWF
jgi:hypothetical protein